MNYTKNHYPDGKFYAQFKDFEDPRIICERIHTYSDLFYIAQLKDVCDHKNIDPLLIIPSLPDAQADRRFNPMESFNLKIVANFINGLNFSRIIIFHPHNPEVVEGMFNNVEIIDCSLFVVQAMGYIAPGAIDNLILMSTDAGGFKPLMKISDKIGWKGETFSASKSRKWNFEKGRSEIVTVIDRQDFQGKNILIVDDVLIYGGTLISIAQQLKDRNVGKLYAYVSHTTVKAPKKELEAYYERIFTTDSMYEHYDLKNMQIFQLDYWPWMNI